MNKDYYKLLGVPRGADEKDIKNAYRKLARKLHPDVNPGNAEAEAKFKEISEAYNVLGDPEKRRKYDQFGSDWESGGFTWVNPNSHRGEEFVGGGGFGDIFENLFSGFGGGGGFDMRAPHRPPEDITQEVEVSLDEVLKGCKRTLSYQASEVCPQCKGLGQVKTRDGRPAICPQCAGQGVIHVPRKVTVTIPAGVAEGAKLRVPGQGVKGSGGKAGDLYAVVKTAPHPTFLRKGEDLEAEVQVGYLDAVLGGEVKVPTLSGSVILTIPEGTQPGQRFRLKGKGLPTRGTHPGDLYARVKITLPKELTSEERGLLGQLRRLQGAKK